MVHVICGAVFAFVFVALTVWGWRKLDVIEAYKTRVDEGRLRKIEQRAKRIDYYGGVYTFHGREIEK